MEEAMPGETGDSKERLRPALEEILHLLTQMQLLAELSASDLDVNRPLLQKGLDVLQEKVDRIAGQFWEG